MAASHNKLWILITAFRKDLRDFARLLVAIFRKKAQPGSWFRILGIIAGALYILNPFDLLSDFVPFIGWIDDATVLGWAATMMHTEAKVFRAQKQDNS